MAEDILKEKLNAKQAELDAYKAKVNEIDDEKTLADEEQEIIKTIDEHDKYISTRKYQLAESVVFDGKEYKRSAVSGFILTLLNKMELNWSMTLGYYQLYMFWKSDRSELTYGELDSTLRTLENIKFKGFDEWRNILIINEFFKANHEEYSLDLGETIKLAQMHSALLDRMKIVTKTTDNVEIEMADAEAEANQQQ